MATELNEKLIVAEDALTELSKMTLYLFYVKLVIVLPAIDVTEYQEFVKAFERN